MTRDEIINWLRSYATSPNTIPAHADMMLRAASALSESVAHCVGSIVVSGGYVSDTIGPVSALPEGVYDLVRRAEGK